MGGKPADRCRSEALFLTENASRSEISIYNFPCAASAEIVKVGRLPLAPRSPAPVASEGIMTRIANALQAVEQRPATACMAAGRPASEARLLAVSKTCAGDSVRAAYGGGQCAFGGGYLEEGLAKIVALADLPLEW